MADIGTQIIDKLVEAVAADCQTPFDEDDLTRVKTIFRGRFQDDPTDLGPVVVIERNYHPKAKNGTSPEFSWFDERTQTEMGMVIGGSAVEFWVRRFSVKIIVWPEAQEQAEAEEVNGTIVSRVRRSITNCDVMGLSDGVGENILLGINPITKMKSRQLGGPDDEYGFEAELFLEYTTEYIP